VDHPETLREQRVAHLAQRYEVYANQVYLKREELLLG
jgi:hypothetical protein